MVEKVELAGRSLGVLTVIGSVLVASHRYNQTPSIHSPHKHSTTNKGEPP